MFTIYPPLNDHDWIAWDRLHAGIPVHTIPEGWTESRAKHFTDAELAAEYWRGEFDYDRAFRDMCYLSGNWKWDKFATHERREVLDRFATHPHALEDS